MPGLFRNLHSRSFPAEPTELQPHLPQCVFLFLSCLLHNPPQFTNFYPVSRKLLTEYAILFTILFLFLFVLSDQPQFLLSLLHPVPSSSPLSQIHCSSVSPQKRAGLPKVSIKYGISHYNKPRHEPSHHGCMWQPNRKKNRQRVRDSPAPSARSPSRTPSYTTIT